MQTYFITNPVEHMCPFPLQPCDCACYHNEPCCLLSLKTCFVAPLMELYRNATCDAKENCNQVSGTHSLKRTERKFYQKSV